MNFKKLVGMTIGPGWRKAIAERVGGVLGCTHLVELLGPLGHHGLPGHRPRARSTQCGKPATGKKPYQINSCHIYKDDAPAVLERWPEFYTGKR